MTEPDDDRTAILTVIDAETKAYLQRDFEGWERCWHDGPEIRRIQAHVGAGVTVAAGSEVRARMHRLLTGKSDWKQPETIRRENINIVVGSEMAWVSYDQIGGPSTNPGELAGHYHEVKILHKIEGAWKIACLVGTQLRDGQDLAPLVEVDEALRVLWMNEAAQDRLPVHPMLGRRGKFLHAVRPEAREDLLAAVAWIAKVRDRHTPCAGKDTVTRAVALGQDDTGLAHICWLILRDGRYLITFDDTDRLDRQIASAAAVYGLSQAQERIARQLADGCDLGAAASALGISINTAKTHLQRIYDKLGVRTQPALVRLLLNADGQGA